MKGTSKKGLRRSTSKPAVDKDAEKPITTVSHALALCIRYATQIGRSQRSLRTLSSNLAHYAHLTVQQREKECTDKQRTSPSKTEGKGSPLKGPSKVFILVPISSFFEDDISYLYFFLNDSMI